MAAIKKHVCKAKCFITNASTLVSEDNPEARALLAVKGREVLATELARFSNAHEFFHGFAEPEAKAETQPEEAAVVAPKRGRPRLS